MRELTDFEKLTKSKYIPYLYGLDLSLSNTGIAIIDLNTYDPILVDSVKTNAKLEHKDRLKQITDKFDELVEKYPPSVVAIENGFVQHNNATKVLFKVRGIAERWFADVPQFFYAPTTIKAAIFDGKAKKELVRKKLESEYPDIEFKNEDESDALGIAVTHLIKTKQIKWIKKLN